jgi:hypothetical protein
MCDFVGDAVEGLELPDVAQIGCSAPNLFRELAAGRFFGSQARREAICRNLITPCLDGILYAIGKLAFRLRPGLCWKSPGSALKPAQSEALRKQR